MHGSGDRMKLICPNVNCINKSVVFRRFNSVVEPACKKCGAVLAAARGSRRQELTAAKAQRDLTNYEISNTTVH